MTSNTLLFNLEKDIVNLLLDKLESYNITLDRASQIAKFVLIHLPDNLTDEQIKKIIPSLDDEFIELAGVVHKYMDDFDQKYKEETVKKMENLIKHKHFEEANNLVKAYLEKKIV